eukprot:7034994-Heterocapsa_arctica.AAC.1
MDTCANGDRQGCLGYIIYEDMGNRSYMLTLKLGIKDVVEMWRIADYFGLTKSVKAPDQLSA